MNEDNPEILNPKDLEHVFTEAQKDGEWIVLSPRGILYKGDINAMTATILKAKLNAGKEK